MRSKFEEHRTFWTLLFTIITAGITGLAVYFGSDLAAVKYSVEVTRTAELLQKQQAESQPLNSIEFNHYEDPSRIIAVDYPVELEGGLERSKDETVISYQVGSRGPVIQTTSDYSFVSNIINHHKYPDYKNSLTISILEIDEEIGDADWEQFIENTVSLIENYEIQDEQMAEPIGSHWLDEFTYLLETKITHHSENIYLLFLFRRHQDYKVLAYATYYGDRQDSQYLKLRQSLESMSVNPIAFQTALAAYKELVAQSLIIKVNSQSPLEKTDVVVINNCLGASEVTQTLTSSTRINVAVESTPKEQIEAQARSAVDASLLNKSTTTISLELPGPPGTLREYSIRISGLRQEGVIENLQPGLDPIPFSILEFTDYQLISMSEKPCSGGTHR